MNKIFINFDKRPMETQIKSHTLNSPVQNAGTYTLHNRAKFVLCYKKTLLSIHNFTLDL